MKKSKLLIIPLLVFGFSLSSCYIPISQRLQITGEWEATDIYFEALDFSVDSLKIVVVENSELDYGFTYTTYRRGQKTLNLSVWENGTNVSITDDEHLFDYAFQGWVVLVWDYEDYTYYFDGNVHKHGNRTYFEGLITITPYHEYEYKTYGLDSIRVVLDKIS